MESIQQFFNSQEDWVKAIIALSMPLLDRESNFYWVYIVFSLILGVGAYRIYNQKSGEFSWRGLLNYCLPYSIYSHPSAIIDYQCYLINGLIKIGLSFSLLINISQIVSNFTLTTLLQNFSEPRFLLKENLTAQIIYTIAVTLCIDFGYFLGHYLLHKIPVLWEFHKIHHSAEVLTPITAKRDHPVDDLVIYTCRACLLGLVTGLFSYTFGGQFNTLTITKITVIIYLFHLSANLRHSHIWISYGWHLNHILVSPAMHQIHHSQLEKHLDKNFGLIFSIWDYLCGTLYVPKERETFDVGLVQVKFNNLWQLYIYPFVSVFNMLFEKISLRKI